MFRQFVSEFHFKPGQLAVIPWKLKEGRCLRGPRVGAALFNLIEQVFRRKVFTLTPAIKTTAIAPIIA